MRLNRNGLLYRQSTSAVILNKNEQMLIVQKNSFKNNEWDIPGGGIEDGEKPELAIIRELSEELGNSKFEVIKVSRLKDSYEWPDEYINQRIKNNKPIFRGQERIQFLVRFTGEEGEIKIQEEEIRVAKWVFLNELSSFLIFPNQMEKMKNLLKEFSLAN